MTPNSLPAGPQLYLDLADRYDQLGQASMRDRFLILAADAALTAGMVEQAERLRARLLHGSRHHMLKPYGSFAQAASSPDVETYIQDLRANYPPETASALLETLQQSAIHPEVPPAPPSHYPSTSAHSTAAPPAPAPSPAAQPTPPVDRWLGTTSAIPATAPVIDLDSELAAPPPRAAPSRPAPPRSAPARQPAQAAPIERTQELPPSPHSDSLPPAPPSARPRAQPRPPDSGMPLPPPRSRPPKPALPPPQKKEPGRPAAGAWFSVLLGLLMLAAALTCAAFALGKAFWPQ